MAFQILLHMTLQTHPRTFISLADVYPLNELIFIDILPFKQGPPPKMSYTEYIFAVPRTPAHLIPRFACAPTTKLYKSALWRLLPDLLGAMVVFQPS